MYVTLILNAWYRSSNIPDPVVGRTFPPGQSPQYVMHTYIRMTSIGLSDDIRQRSQRRWRCRWTFLNCGRLAPTSTITSPGWKGAGCRVSVDCRATSDYDWGSYDGPRRPSSISQVHAALAVRMAQTWLYLHGKNGPNAITWACQQNTFQTCKIPGWTGGNIRHANLVPEDSKNVWSYWAHPGT